MTREAPSSRGSRALTSALFALVFAAIAPLPALSGCGEQVVLGGDGKKPDPQCKDAVCGVPCERPACPDDEPDCGEPGTAGACDGHGKCDVPAPHCPAPPCEGRHCAEPCMPEHCEGPDCHEMPGESSCDDHGACVTGPVMCPPPFDPCEGVPCGTPCKPCPPGEMGCMMPPPQGVCGDDHACVPPMQAKCDPPPPPPMPCMGKPCGAPCKLCDPQMDPECMDDGIPRACDDHGDCDATPVLCP